MRRFERCGRTYLIRGNDVRRVEHEGQSRLLSEVEAMMEDQFRFSREIQYKGRKAFQYVSETTVTLSGPAQNNADAEASSNIKRSKGVQLFSGSSWLKSVIRMEPCSRPGDCGPIFLLR
ncbi:MAG: hypothetical protein IPM55_16575 [Acidobacteria bacterium]|nr:hypothetical protein [Acidobacteriota bacterium]